MTQYRSSTRASHHPMDMDARLRERLRRDHAHTPPETVPPAGTVLDVVPLPDTARFDTTRFDVTPSGRAWPGSRSPNTPAPVSSPGGLRIDRPSRCAWADGREVDLTFQEFELLAHLMAHPGTIFSRAELMKALWPTVDDATRTVDVHVHRLRRKLGRAGAQLTTVRRVGYVYRPLADKTGLPQTSE